MNKILSQELISAYFDGEVTSEERVLVEEYLKNSEEANREFHEIEKLSSLVQELPEEAGKAPVEFRSAVLKQIERESLLAEVKKPESKWKKFSPYVALLTTAACLFLMIQIFPTSEHADRDYQTSGIKESSQAASEGELANREEPEIMIASKEKTAKLADRSPRSRFSVSSEERFYKKNGQPESGSPEGESESLAYAPDRDGIHVLPASLDKNSLNIVTVTCSNREESLQKLEKLLVEQNVQKANIESSTDKELGEKSDPNIVAVYVEANEVQVSNTINEIQNTTPVFGCAVVPESKSRNLENRFSNYFVMNENQLSGFGINRQKGTQGGHGGASEKFSDEISVDSGDKKDSKSLDTPAPVENQKAKSLWKSFVENNRTSRGVNKETVNRVPEEEASELIANEPPPPDLPTDSRNSFEKGFGSINNRIIAKSESKNQNGELSSLEEDADVKADNSGQVPVNLGQQVRLNLPKEFITELEDNPSPVTPSKPVNDYLAKETESQEGQSGQDESKRERFGKKSSSGENQFGGTRITSVLENSPEKNQPTTPKPAPPENIRTVFVLIEVKPEVQKKAMSKPAETKVKARVKEIRKKSS